MRTQIRNDQTAQPKASRKLRTPHFGIGAAAIVVAVLGALPVWAQTNPSLQVTAKRVAEGIGELVKTTPEHKDGPVFVFEEYHNSRVGQVQIATMLTRLYQQQRLRIVGLEGAIKGPAPLPTEKYLKVVEGQTRSDVLKDLLRQAEISGVEYAGAVLPGLQVVGIENADEYKVRAEDGAAPEFMAILTIAERTLPREKLEEIAAKLSDGKIEDVLTALKASDPWIKARLETMKNPSLKLADSIGNTQAILDKAKSLNLQLPAEVANGLEASINFYRTAEKRSETMADAMAELAKQNTGRPVAMIIGAAHTERVLAALEKKGVAAAVLRAKDFKGEHDLAGTRRFQLKSKGLWGNDEPGSLGAILNPKKGSSIEERKPQPVIGDVKRDGYASAQAAAKIAAKAVRDGDEFPKVIIDRLQALPGIKVDPTSFEKKGYDVIFAFDIEDTSGKTQKVWVRAGTKPIGSPSSNDPVDVAFLELKKAEKEAGLEPKTDAGKGGDKEPPKDKKKTGTEEPGEGKGKGNGLKEGTGLLTNREAQAKFFRSATEARSHPPISQ